MNFKVTFIPDKDYYKEAYNEMISPNKLKKYEPLFASIMVVFGIGLYFFDNSNKLGILSLVFSGFGLYEFYKFYNEKRKWLKDRLDSKIAGQSLKFEFTDSMIILSGPFSTGELKWNGLRNIIKTKNGILLKPENGISIYLPDRIFMEKEQINFIMSKKKS